MKKILSLALIIMTALSILTGCNTEEEMVTEKPVIYVYSKTPTTIKVGIEKIHGESLDLTYPKAKNNYWEVKTNENGKITVNDKNYNYLYWEDSDNYPLNVDKGFCVRGIDTASFLEEKLEDLGLNEYERNDFITYWLPQMVGNKYNLISFNPPEYEKYYALKTFPKADNTIRVMMIFKSSDEFIDLEPQHLSAFNDVDRNGTTVVEWGGVNLDKR